MKQLGLGSFVSDFRSIFNFSQERSRARSYILLDSLIGTIANVFVTGIFYTGFLSMYEISINNIGLLTAIPVIANCFSLFTAPILERFKKRKLLLSLGYLYYHFMQIIATTIMPNFVLDPDARVVWFMVLMFLGSSVYALIAPGWTVWYSRMYPRDNKKRTLYFTYSQIITSVSSNFILMVSSIITDAVAGSPYQNTLILGFRYFGFALVLLNSIMILCKMPEPSYPPGERLSLISVFTLPFQHKKLLACLLFMFTWNYVANLVNGVWNVHLLNHLHLPYTMISFVSISYSAMLVLLQPLWRRVLNRYSWIKTFGIALLVWIPTELLLFLVTPANAQALYIPISLWQQVSQVGLNLAYANILYINMPQENSSAYISFQTVGCSIFSFLGILSGSAISGITGDTAFLFLGMEVYSVQFLTLIRFVFLLIMALICLYKWRVFTSDKDIRELEELDAMARKRRALQQ